MGIVGRSIIKIILCLLLPGPGTELLNPGNLLGDQGDRSMFCSDAVTLREPLKSFRTVSEPPSLDQDLDH